MPQTAHYTPRTTKLLGGILVSLRPSVHPASRVRSVAPTVPVSCVKFLAKFQNLNFWQFFKICNFDFVFWLGIWCESLVWVIMGWRGVFQNAGVLVVLFEVTWHVGNIVLVNGLVLSDIQSFPGTKAFPGLMWTMFMMRHGITGGRWVHVHVGIAYSSSYLKNTQILSLR